MNISPVSVRYAKSVFELAKEKNSIEAVSSDVKSLAEICNKSKEFTDLLTNPIIKSSEKSAIFNGLFGKEFNKITMSLFDLLLKNKRENFLPSILRNFTDMYRKNENIKSATLTSSDKLDDSLKSEIITKLKDALNAEIDMEEKVNERLIGGFILRVEDKQIDASIASKLEKVKRELMQKEL